MPHAPRAGEVTSVMALAAVLLASAMPSGAHAQWSVVRLHPQGATQSGCNAVNGGQQAGQVTFTGGPRAALWSGSAGSWVDLTPAGHSASVSELDGVNQVGSAFMSARHAALWSGSAASWIDLHPSWATESWATGVSNGQQVGYGNLATGFPRACLWTGSAASCVDLNPANGVGSYASGVGGGTQVGQTYLQGNQDGHASLWSGSAASFIDLHPAAAIYGSSAAATDGIEQVGFANFYDDHAALWRGTAASWVDLHPVGVDESTARAVSGGFQAGQTRVGPFAGGAYHAALWNGSAESWVDLHTFLPPGFSSSNANGIWVEGAQVYVVGSGFNSQSGTYEALMWTVPSPPGMFVMVAGAFPALRRRRGAGTMGRFKLAAR